MKCRLHLFSGENTNPIPSQTMRDRSANCALNGRYLCKRISLGYPTTTHQTAVLRPVGLRLQEGSFIFRDL